MEKTKKEDSIMTYQAPIDQVAISQAELLEYLEEQSKAIAWRGDLDFSFKSLQQSTSTILEHAFELADCKQRLSKKEYKQLLKEYGWEGEEKKYLKLAAVFEGFSPQDLDGIEPDTLFVLAKNNKKYQNVIDQLQELPEVTQEAVRELMKQERQKAKQPIPKKPTIWRRTKDGSAYCQIPPIHEEDYRTGTLLQRMVDEEGLSAQQIVAEAISLRQAFKEGRLIMVEDESQVQSDSSFTNSENTSVTEKNHTQFPEASPTASEVEPAAENPQQNDYAENASCAFEDDSSNDIFVVEEETAIEEKKAPSLDEFYLLLQQANSWLEIIRSAQHCSDEVKTATWTMLGSTDKQRIYQGRLRVAKVEEVVVNLGLDYQHKISLNIKGMVKNRKLAKEISDVAWGNFLTIFEYKGDIYLWYKMGKNFPLTVIIPNEISS